jgi:tetratricopeptide (TPR) repeat protein
MVRKDKIRPARRNGNRLATALASAQTPEDQALAHYRLGLFHDNNSREAAAIPHYEEALALGLPPDIEASALAWLASSLYKTGFPDRALAALRQASALTPDPSLQRFLGGLERRIDRSLQRSGSD